LCDTALSSYDAEQTNRSSSCLWGAGCPPDSPSMARLAAVHVLVRCPASGVGRFHGVCYSAYVKTSRLCDTASRAWNGRTIGASWGRFLTCILMANKASPWLLNLLLWQTKRPLGSSWKQGNRPRASCPSSSEGRDHTVRRLCVSRSQTRLYSTFIKQGGTQGRVPPAMRQGCRIGRVPCPHASRFKALVWHDDRMAEDVSRDPP
jgi:hypothetical protein